MATYTEHYGLHQWESTDDFLRTDFNTDFQKIDGAIGGLLVFGSYTGDGAASREIGLGFTPRAVLVASGEGRMGGSGGEHPMIYGGLALPGAPVGTSSTRVALEVTEGGFRVYEYGVDFDYIRINREGMSYYYMAVR